MRALVTNTGTRTGTAPGHGQAGLTLMEIMIAVAILALMMAMAWTTITATVESKNRAELNQERSHELRVAMSLMAHDISSAYLSQNEDPNQDNRRTWFMAKSSSPVGELRFSSLGHRVLWADANESEQTLISYGYENSRTQPGKVDLIRRESRRLSNEPWENEPAEVDILLRDIEEVEFEYFNWKDNEWQDNWNTVNADSEKNRLPEFVRITVTIRDADGDEYKRVTQARINMVEALSFFQR